MKIGLKELQSFLSNSKTPLLFHKILRQLRFFLASLRITDTKNQFLHQRNYYHRPFVKIVKDSKTLRCSQEVMGAQVKKYKTAPVLL
jgi:hypothetical protein